MFGGFGILYSLFVGAGCAVNSMKKDMQREEARQKAIQNPDPTGTYVANGNFYDIQTGKLVFLSSVPGGWKVIDPKNGRVLRNTGEIAKREQMKKEKSKYSDHYPFKTVSKEETRHEKLNENCNCVSSWHFVTDLKTGEEYYIDRSTGNYYRRRNGYPVRFTDILRNSFIKRGYTEEELMEWEKECMKKRTEEFEEKLRENTINIY